MGKVGQNHNIANHPALISPLKECTIAVKDNICTKKMKTSCGSAMLRDFTSPFDATVVKLLSDAGATITGKTNCDEFGMGSMNVHSVHGPVVNPFNFSGGSAAAVAAGMCHVALGTDTGGSIRLPASYCGTAGLKPSYGLISRYGVVSYADSLDTVGLLAKDIAQIEPAFQSLNKYDHNDPTSVDEKTRERARDVSQRLEEYFPSELYASSSILSLTIIFSPCLHSLGATILPVSLPSTKYALSAYYVIASAEASSNLARYDGVRYGLRVPPSPGSDLTSTAKIYANTRSQGFGREVRKRMLLGTYALSADAFDNYFLQAQRVRQMVQNDFDRVFRVENVLYSTVSQDESHPISLTSSSEAAAGAVDVLIHPSAIQTAPLLKRYLIDYVQDVLTVPASLAGLPALSVPMKPIPEHSEQEGGDGDGDGWPIGISIVGQWGTDELVLKVGRVVERLGKS
ncbi:amidase signature enzyme [Gymnopus androsaceus JB14]|uniref:Glutamyl-tRNA(Gln) amidotransferase subunit A, mitochondrial n=1 Tax=Gymnopus androsaceus JB14 TaxID=1447944 RepID=A0A6A4I742_9AGAR|nr:amidase signature enzyme [Gymnopus androsaceus JB14]